MRDEKKILLMTKLAVQDKKYGEKDRRITSYYLEDYRYVKNLWTRIGIFLVVSFAILINILIKVEKGLRIPTTLGEIMKVYIIPYGSILVVLFLLYSILSSIIFTKEYRAAEKRIKEYEEVLDTLKHYEEEIAKGGEEEDGIY